MSEASPICRGKNLTLETVLAFVNAMPKKRMKKNEFHSFAEERMKGWTQTHSQIARQLALYYEEDGDCIPRFCSQVSSSDVYEYVKHWATLYYVPNLYTPSLNEYAPKNIYAAFRQRIDEGKNGFDTACLSLFGVVLNNTDKVRVYLNNFTDLIIENNTISRNAGIIEEKYPPVIPPINHLQDAKEYFFYFGSTIQSTSNINTQSNIHPLQKIYYGTPGSGKSHKVKEIVEGLYPEEQERDKYVFRTTFHPDSDYASFVGCYKPQMDGTGDIKYEFTPQAFTNAYARAWKESEKQVYLVIEEINRGNCAQIFGDLFQLLDRKGGVSEYPINADTDLRQYLEKDDILGKGHEGIANGKLKLPANLNIVATMNTSDQSLFPMDSAFKRRWSWECVPINYDDDKSGAFAITIGNSRYKWLEFLKAVNKKIFKATDSEDKQMGNFFINGDVDKRQFIDKVMFYLWNDICKEEYRTTNNFFRIFVDDKKIETTEFSFNELFGTNAETLLKGFMVFLGVEPIQSEGDASVTETNTD